MGNVGGEFSSENAVCSMYFFGFAMAGFTQVEREGFVGCARER